MVDGVELKAVKNTKGSAKPKKVKNPKHRLPTDDDDDDDDGDEEDDEDVEKGKSAETLVEEAMAKAAKQKQGPANKETPKKEEVSESDESESSEEGEEEDEFGPIPKKAPARTAPMDMED